MPRSTSTVTSFPTSTPGRSRRTKASSPSLTTSAAGTKPGVGQLVAGPNDWRTSASNSANGLRRVHTRLLIALSSHPGRTLRPAVTHTNLSGMRLSSVFGTPRANSPYVDRGM
ncbi:Uncharacterised protein [Mycobacteroides abscessus subsp. abscessus]|nr:Uncharacterised protein [Mycobacteroides abscessus subsp. abscessus]